MWWLGLTLLILHVISTNAGGSWVRYGPDDRKYVNWKVDEEAFKKAIKVIVDDKIEEKKDYKIEEKKDYKIEEKKVDQIDEKKDDYDWGGIGGYGEEKFYGVAIGYEDVVDGKILKVNEEEVRNKDNFVRPCAFDDWECIRKFFAHNSDCIPAYGPIPDPLLLKQNTLFFTHANATFTLTDHKVRGLSSSKIVEFYYNKKTGDVVFAIEVTNLNETTPKGYLSYRRTAKESIVLADFATILFKSITFTAVIPKLPKLRLEQAEIHADVRDSFPDFFIGPKAYTSKDPDVIKAYADIIAFFPITVREGVQFQAPLYTSLFIQKNVCDFGIKLNSV